MAELLILALAYGVGMLFGPSIFWLLLALLGVKDEWELED